MIAEREYGFGNCKYCKEFKALKNGVCFECQEHCVGDMPDFLNDLFGFEGDINE